MGALEISEHIHLCIYVYTKNNTASKRTLDSKLVLMKDNCSQINDYPTNPFVIGF